jgi:D-alanine-D-alanine ligase
LKAKKIQTAVLGGKVIGSVEIIPKRNFYDYQAKYSKSAKTKHVIPPRISKKFLKKSTKFQ